MFGFQLDGAGSKCTGSAQPGTVNLRSAVLELPRYAAVGDLGIYNCRPPRGATTGVSLHGEGRAWDAQIPDGARPVGDALALELVALAPALGVQRVIWWRREWDAASRRWDPYGGVDPHTGHAHVELCWAAARGLTLAAARAALAGTQQEDDDDMDRIMWFAASGGAHAYRVRGLEAKHLSSPAALNLCRFLGMDEPPADHAGGERKPLDATWRASVAMLDGPCRNV